jgi:hypothetical protein
MRRGLAQMVLPALGRMEKHMLGENTSFAAVCAQEPTMAGQGI